MPGRRKSKPYDPSAKPHDRTGKQFYADLPAGRAIAVEVDDPYGVPSDAEAKLVTSWGTRPSDVVREWQAPQAPRRLVARTRRDDPIGGLFARGQIDRAAYEAARHYQALVERAGRGIHSPSLDPRVQGIVLDGLTDVQLRAARRLRHVVAKIMLAVGRLGLSVLHSVAVDGMSPGKIAASVMGARLQRNVDFIGKLLRRALDELASILGLVARPRQVELPIVAWAAAAVQEGRGLSP